MQRTQPTPHRGWYLLFLFGPLALIALIVMALTEPVRWLRYAAIVVLGTLIFLTVLGLALSAAGIIR